MNFKSYACKLFATTCICAAGTFSGAAQGVTIDLDPTAKGAAIGDLHYGIFFEEINHAGDGGLYAELIRNRSFEDNTSNPTNWSRVGTATIGIVTEGLLNQANSAALNLNINSPGDGVENTGYWGINAVEGRQYDLSFWVKGTWDGIITASLVKADGISAGAVDIPVKSTDQWQKVTATLTATASDTKATFRLTGSKAGSISIDVVSLFPPTYKDRPNGCRPDLAEMLAAMKPSFVRFPGGCFVEGQASGTGNNRFEWKKSIGPIETRPGHWNQNWGYRVTDGFGFHEMLQLTEDLGAEPLYVVNIGLGHDWLVDYREIDEYIQEALDAIEYCNGSTSTTWGALRAANGHPEPFNLRLLEIGNENYQTDASQQSDHYAERYRAFYDAIKARYPEMILIGNVEAWGTDDPTWRNPHPVEVVDEHYYRNPAWFLNQYGKYDSYDRSKPKVYVGEYAVTQDFGTNGHLNAALGEAAYMLGMENNSDVCVMNSYAPIFINEDDQCWKPDMIRFNTYTSFGTPSYHVQKLMSNLHGKQNISRTESGNIETTGHKIALSTWSTCATYDNVKVTDANGTVIFSDGFQNASSVWSADGGTWTVTDGVLSQTDASVQGKAYVAGITAPDSYTLEVDAVKKSGNEGFLVAFNYGDSENYCWWNIGGWSNTAHAIEVCNNGAKTSYGYTGGTITTGRTYHIKIEVNGEHIRCYLDGSLIHDVTLPVQRKVYVASSIDEEAGLMYVKLVNASSENVPVTLNITNGSFVGTEDVTVLTSANGTDENSMASPMNVAPVSGSMDALNDASATYTAPAYSLNILRLKISDIPAIAPGAKPSVEEEQAVKDELASLAAKLTALHASTALPTSTSTGAQLTWSLSGHDVSLLGVAQGEWYARLNVASPLTNESPVTGAVLTATVKYPGGAVATIDFPVTVAASDGMYGYLYCYMNAGKEITNFAIGTAEDRGKTFTELLGGAEVFDTNTLAAIEHGTRDSYLARGRNGGEYFMLTTDMCVATSGVWNNYGIDMLRSSDLIHWEGDSFDFRKGKSIFSDPTATTAEFPSDADYAEIDRVWAPQWIWDETANGGQGAYLVYYSMTSSGVTPVHDRIYYSYADKDFKTLTQPRLFYDPGYSVIDADIVYNPYDGLYRMCIKHEGAAASEAGVYILSSDRLTGGDWTETAHIATEGTEAVEGASLVRLIDEDVYNLYFMRYSGGTAYKVCEMDHLATTSIPSENVAGTGSFQHGSVMHVNYDEYTVLQCWSDITALLKEARESGSEVFTSAIVQAEAALEYTTVPELAKELPEALQALRDAKSEYMKEVMGGGEEVTDITFLLNNPDFNAGGDGWSGTGFTAASNGVAEHWNKTFDTYQILQYMPAGHYTLTCSGFYRNGSKTTYTAHINGTEQLLAKLYLNDDEAPFMSLYDSSAPYTNSPYTYPDNVSQANTAFNTAKAYSGNGVTTVLAEAGDLRVGIRKTAFVGDDWTCFDNFRLIYNPDLTGVESVAIGEEEETAVNVYSITGVLLRAGVNRADAVTGLTPGLYIVGHRKVAVR